MLLILIIRMDRFMSEATGQDWKFNINRQLIFWVFFFCFAEAGHKRRCFELLSRGSYQFGWKLAPTSKHTLTSSLLQDSEALLWERPADQKWWRWHTTSLVWYAKTLYRGKNRSAEADRVTDVIACRRRQPRRWIVDITIQEKTGRTGGLNGLWPASKVLVRNVFFNKNLSF